MTAKSILKNFGKLLTSTYGRHGEEHVNNILLRKVLQETDSRLNELKDVILFGYRNDIAYQKDTDHFHSEYIHFLRRHHIIRQLTTDTDWLYEEMKKHYLEKQMKIAQAPAPPASDIESLLDRIAPETPYHKIREMLEKEHLTTTRLLQYRASLPAPAAAAEEGGTVTALEEFELYDATLQNFMTGAEKIEAVAASQLLGKYWGTLENYETFLQLFPGNRYADRMRKRMEILRLQKCSTLEDFEKFVVAFPQNHFGSQVEDCLFHYAETVDNFEVYRRCFPQGRYTEKVDMLEEKACFRSKDYAKYLEKYPQGKYRIPAANWMQSHGDLPLYLYFFLLPIFLLFLLALVVYGLIKGIVHLPDTLERHFGGKLDRIAGAMDKHFNFK